MTTTLYDTDGRPIEHGYEVLMTPKDVASILTINTRTLAKYAKAGRIRHVWTVGGHRRYPASAVRAAYEGRWDDAARDDGSVTIENPCDAVVHAAS